MNICCKTFCPEKGLHDLVAAYRKIDSRGMRLVLAGDDFQATAYSTRLKTVTRQTGCVFPPGDIDRLAARLQEVVNKSGQIKTAYQKLVVDKYNRKKIAVDILGVYQKTVRT